MRPASVRLSAWELGVLLRGLEDVLVPEGRVDLARDMVALRRKLTLALYGRCPSKLEKHGGE